DGEGDAHATETLIPIDHNFYSAHNNTPSYSGTSAKDRYLEFVATNGGTQTQVKEYTNATFTTLVTTQTLPTSAIVYVKGRIYCKGEIGGRVSVVSSDDIVFDGNISYASGQTHADAGHSTAFLAKDKLFFRPDSVSASGILYAENSSRSSAAFDAGYNLNWQSDSSKTQLRLYGNRVMNGSTNMSIYSDRVYGYDKNLKYFRPPGLPVRPAVKTVREV
ncbi:MAG: hypothetical protein NC930_08090, partial [Candidatus Omnitrophica bacterium]|nr:hypothetical protein [Candidatus Omnitrophota bacterium]